MHVDVYMCLYVCIKHCIYGYIRIYLHYHSLPTMVRSFSSLRYMNVYKFQYDLIFRNTAFHIPSQCGSLHSLHHKSLLYMALTIQHLHVASNYFTSQCIPAISISQGTPTILMPLMTVIIISAIKDAVEDIVSICFVAATVDECL